MGRHSLYGVCIDGWLVYFLQFNVRMEFAALPYKVNRRINDNGPNPGIQRSTAHIICMNVLEYLQKTIMQNLYCIFLVAGISQANRCHGAVELLIQAFLGLAAVIDTTIYQFYISSIGGQSSLLYGVDLKKPECSLNAKIHFSLTANCQLLIIIRSWVTLRLGKKEKNEKLC